VHGRDYYFVSTDEFEAQVKADAFAEHALVHGNWYGTLRSAIDESLAGGRSLVISCMASNNVPIALPSEVTHCDLKPGHITVCTVFVVAVSAAVTKQRGALVITRRLILSAVLL
jgi:guanylate kinase